MGYVQSDLELFKFDYALNFDLTAIPDFNIPIPSPPPPPPIKVADIDDIPMEVSTPRRITVEVSAQIEIFTIHYVNLGYEADCV